ncbi:integrin alpha-PS5-like [Plodia interpunctella]|uniref:integrin alpha-PS5-like n=1 Tax=Plodia interpunctella TaxID=58824 RepID=UPI00236896BF|nr:integrin alpha-PS5-like [Plodia interpunctella]
MKLVILLLLYDLRWLSAALIYHEGSIKEFGAEISDNSNSFGYSVTFTPDNKRLIVGAPKANDVGALFTCDIEIRNCTQISTNVDAPKDFHIWLGANVKAGTDFFATCAPRYYNKNNFGIFSRCYKYNTKNNAFIKLKEKHVWSKIFQDSMLTLGWSMDVDTNDNILVGGPAMYKGRAAVYIKQNSPLIIQYEKIPTNFGYSVLNRIYQNKKEILVSSTYGHHGFGMVLFRDFKTGAIMREIRGKQVGAMFGASLCAVSVGPGGQSVLLVGAPTYALQEMYNTGAVFVYKDIDTNIYREVLGNSNNGHFGYALANLGDLNGDKKDDIAISAPYEDENRGVVYIYSAAHLLDRDKAAPYLQRITSEKYHSFGLSLYALPDYDQNGCKELAIGAPQSNTTVLLRCLATVTVTVKELKPRGKLSITTGFASFMFESCLSFQYPKLPETINATFSVQVNIPNLKIEISETSKMNTITYRASVTSDKKEEYCQNLTVSTPLDAPYEPTMYYQISAILLDDPRDVETFSPSRVTTSDLSVLTVPGTAWLGECMNIAKCIPKLDMSVRLSIPTSSPYIVGSTDQETVRISVKSEGDPAYSTCIRVYLKRINLHSMPNSCVLPPAGGNETLLCRPIKLLRNKTTWDIDIKLDTKSIESDSDEGDKDFQIIAHLYDDCSANITNEKAELVPLKRDSAHVVGKGVIKHGGMINITRDEIETSSKQIQHTYIINNKGPTTWHTLRAIVTLQKEFFLDGISPISNPDYECTQHEDTDNEYVSNCEIFTLKGNQKQEIVLAIDILPKIFETLKNKQLKVTSHLKLFVDGAEKSASVVSTLRFYEIKVETWILVVAALFGVVIIMIAAFILYECGFLRRKKKQDLRELRKNVLRQSVRRSTVIQHNVKDNSERERLIKEEKSSTEEGPSTSNNAEVNEEFVKKEKEINNKADEIEIQVDDKDKKDQGAKSLDSVECFKTEIKKGKKNDPIANIIIGGLQKNIRRRDVQPDADNNL